MADLKRRLDWHPILRTLGTIALVTSLGACAETADDGDGSPDGNVPLAEAQIGLEAMTSCGDLESYIKSVASAELDKGFAYYNEGMPVDVAIGAEPPSESFNDTAGQAGAENNPEAPSDGESKGTSTPTPSPGPGAIEHSDTNNQVEGVDEADIVKTDGGWMYVLSGRHLRILKSHPAEDTALVGGIEIAGQARDIFLSGDRVLVYSTAWGQKPFGNEINIGIGGGPVKGAAPTQTEPAPPPASFEEPGDDEGDGALPPEEDDGDSASSDDEPSPGASKPGAGKETEKALTAELRGQVTILTIIDVKDRENPSILRTVAMEADYHSARMIGSKVYTVTRGQLFLPGLGFGYAATGSNTTVSVDTPPSSGSSSGSSGSAGGADTPGAMPAEPPADDPPEDEPGSDDGKSDTFTDEEGETLTPEDIKAKYLAELDKGSIAEWMPKVVEIVGDTTVTTDLGSCGSFYKPTVQQGLSLLSIIELDLAAPEAELGVTTTLGNVGTIYASETAIYAASYVYGYWYWAGEEDKDAGEFTMVHRFDISSGSATYTGSGKFTGELLNQFSMDEHDGHLRVATTDHNWSNENESVSAVYVLNSDLEVVGSVGDLGLGERIYSARFMGERGYVVTFKQIDPLYTLDLSDHTSPKVGGELKIPGFSTYIHPLGENHLLTIGRDTTDAEGWTQVEGVAVQIFDVTDINAPALAHKQVFGNAGTSSEALYDHKAFNFFAEKGLLAIPFSSYGWSGGGVAEPGVGIPVDAEETDPAPPEDGGTDEDGDTDEPPEPGAPAPMPEEDPEWVEPSFEAGVMVFKIDATDGIAEIGTIDHKDLVPELESGTYFDSRMLEVRRTLLIEDALYSVGTAGVKVVSADDLTELAKVLFPEEDLCTWCGDDKDGGIDVGGTGTDGSTPPPEPSDPEPTPAPEPDPGS